MQLSPPRNWLVAVRQWRGARWLFGGGWKQETGAHPSDLVRVRAVSDGLQKHLAALQARSPQLKRCSGELETAFMQVSVGLEKLAEESTGLFEKCEAVRGMQAGLGTGDMIQPVVQLLNKPLNFLEGCEQDMQAVMQMLRAADSHIEGVLLASQDVRRMMAPLTFMQVLFRVESARLPTELQQMFVALTDDIQRLHARMLETFTVRLDAVHQSRDTVHHGIDRLEQILEEHARTTATQRARVSGTVKSVEGELTEKRSLETELAELTRTVSHQVGQIVIGLQSQDIIAQRLAHVVEAIGRLVDACQSKPFDLNSDEELGQFALFSQLEARLQEEHLRDIESEAARSEERIQSGLTSILGCVRKISEVTGLSRGACRAEELSQMVEVLREPIVETQRRTDEVCDLIGSLGGQAADLTSIINELADSIWLGGLNAQVQSAKVAVGTGLEVLSAQTCTIADETRSAATAICAKVDALVAEFDGIVSRLGNLRDASHQHNETLSTEGARHVLQLKEFSTRNHQHTHEVAGLAGSIITRIGELQSTAQFANGFSGSIASTLAVLSEVMDAAGQLVEMTGVEELTPEWQARLDGHYSMASEVDAHQRALGVSRSRSTIPSVDAPRNSAAPAVSTPEPAPGGVVPLADTLQEGASEIASGAVAGNAAVSGAGDFGSNVELF